MAAPEILPTVLVDPAAPVWSEAASRPPVVVLKSAAFRAEREASWRELEALVGEVERRGVRMLSAADLARLPGLYRAAVSSLSVARAISLDRNVLEWLESLCARAYLVVYGTRRHLREAVSDFVGRRFPAAVRAHAWHVALTALVLVLGTATGFALTLADADRFYAFVSPMVALGRGPTSTTEALREVLYAKKGAAELLTSFAMFLFSHNARIAILAFAIGFAGGVPSALMIFGNGLVLGAFAALYHSRGLSVELWAWLLPHGVTELFAVVLCGAGGLALGQALVFPGRDERLRSLSTGGREAAVLAIGAVGMLFVAGLVEGIFRQLVHSVPARYAVAAGFAVLWGAYFALAGRERAGGSSR
ncbi:MAG TPA: stage II sporulation protein M [Anaeromyxobacteraceae bacterium]|nr:stage II sporulation protein M [Anaeromyxobacteraceae bacterium]